jgi:hypothetical protein
VPVHLDRPAPTSAGPLALTVHSEESFALARPVVPATRDGAGRLGSAYWHEVERSTRGAVRARRTPESVELCFFGRAPALLRFGAAEIQVDPTGISCTYPVLGGLLARGAGGELVFEQRRSPALCVRTLVRDFSPRLAGRLGRAGWRGFVYHQVQARLHRAIGRRYVARLVQESLP